MPLNLNRRSSSNTANAGSSNVSVNVASKARVIYAHDGVVVWWLTDTRLGGSTLGVGRPEPLERGVGNGSLGHHGRDGKGSKCELHVESRDVCWKSGEGVGAGW